jgi:RimJ/RimL family protein N-acetyltransferase
VKEDAALLYEWLNDAEIMLSLGDEIYGKFSKSELEKEIEAHPQGNSYQFMIETKEGVGIGRCILFNVDSLNNSAMIGIFLGDRTQWGKGLAKEAM